MEVLVVLGRFLSSDTIFWLVSLLLVLLSHFSFEFWFLTLRFHCSNHSDWLHTKVRGGYSACIWATSQQHLQRTAAILHGSHSDGWHTKRPRKGNECGLNGGHTQLSGHSKYYNIKRQTVRPEPRGRREGELHFTKRQRVLKTRLLILTSPPADIPSQHSWERGWRQRHSAFASTSSNLSSAWVENCISKTHEDVWRDPNIRCARGRFGVTETRQPSWLRRCKEDCAFL